MAQQLLNRQRVLLAWPHDTQDTEFLAAAERRGGRRRAPAFAVGLGEARG